MKILTKLMLASAVMVTSGFAVEPVVVTDEVIDGTIKVESGTKWETTKDHTITSTGSVILEKSDIDEYNAHWMISKGNTIDVKGGSVMVDGEGEQGPTITLNGTLKLTPDEEGKYPSVNMNNALIQGIYQDAVYLNRKIEGDLEDDKEDNFCHCPEIFEFLEDLDNFAEINGEKFYLVQNTQDDEGNITGRLVLHGIMLERWFRCTWEKDMGGNEYLSVSVPSELATVATSINFVDESDDFWIFRANEIPGVFVETDFFVPKTGALPIISVLN